MCRGDKNAAQAVALTTAVFVGLKRDKAFVPRNSMFGGQGGANRHTVANFGAMLSSKGYVIAAEKACGNEVSNQLIASIRRSMA